MFENLNFEREKIIRVEIFFEALYLVVDQLDI